MNWKKKQWEEQHQQWMTKEKSYLKTLEELKNQRKQYHTPARDQWNAQLQSGNLDAIGWIQQINQWKDFYPAYVQLFSQLYQTQYELSKMSIHE